MGRLCRNYGSSAAAIFAVIAILSVHCSVTVSAAPSPSFIGGFAGDFFPIETECRGSIAECSFSDSSFSGDGISSEAEEFEMESETSRRILAGRRYISYGALRSGSVPCSRRGASYYNCRRGAQANPYSRGCSTITRCRR